MLKIVDNNNILINRGDIGLIAVTATNQDGSAYTFKLNDIVRIKVMEPKDCDTIVLEKDVTVDEELNEVNICLDSEDTTIGEVINFPVTYWYEIELNPDTAPQTIIGYDEDGPKLFTLYPEGGKI